MVTSEWDTAASGEDADTRPFELSTLGEHRAQCAVPNPRWTTLRCGAGQVMGFVSSRLVTTSAVLLSVAVLWWTWV